MPPSPNIPTIIQPGIRHPLYRGTPDLAWRYHVGVAVLGLLAIAATIISLWAPDPAGTPTLCAYAAAITILGRAITPATRRAWRPTPTNRQPTTATLVWALISVADGWRMAIPLVFTTITAITTGHWMPLVIAVAGLWAAYAWDIGTAYRAWRSTQMHPRSKAHRR